MAGVRPEVAEARVAREALGLGLAGPLDDILRAIEEDGEVPVAVLDLPDDLAGLFRRRKGQALIAINGNHAFVRQRFTLAHEFGHYRLGHGTVIDGADFAWSKDPKEVQANYFAGEFLAPRQAVYAWLEAQGDPSVDLEVIVRFGCRFGLSAKAARVRFESASVIGKTKAAQLDKQIAAEQHKHVQWALGLQPVSDSLTAIRSLPRIPQQMTARARRVYAAGLMDIEEVAARTGQELRRVRDELGGVEVASPAEDEF